MNLETDQPASHATRPPRRNMKLTLAYDGSGFKGWQVQPGQPTVQATVAAAIERIAGHAAEVHGSGRTDAGVHALAQTANFELCSPIPTQNLLSALNDALPPAIRVIAVDEVHAEFHARLSARAKTYRYRIFRAEICPPFLAAFVYHHPYPLNEEAMSRAAGEVVGRHDFTSFAAVDPERDRDPRAENTREIFSSTFRREGDELIYEVRGSGFLHHMVRNLVGTFLLVGKGTLQPDQLRTILAAKLRSANPGATAPASGLYLISVEY